MFDMILDGLLTCLTPINILTTFIAVSLGIIVGALPGFGASIGMIIVLPLTYTMDPGTALIALTGVYVGCEYGGSISSILLNTPGTSAAMVTAFDGYPMARNGHARKALFLSNISSFCGGIMSGLSMLLFLPILAPLVIKFGALEILLLTMVGLFLVGTISAGDPYKGMVSAALGIFVTCIGIDSYIGNPRFDFGIDVLIGGIPFVPVMLGIFSLPSMLELALSRHHSSPQGKNIMFEKNSFRDNVREFKKIFHLLFTRMKKLLVRSGLYGAIIGIVPGVGASVATMAAYSSAKQASAHPEKFGSGAEEGIAAAECANNALVGGAYIPVLALGIPGSPAAAILMAAIFMHGMTPGPNFLANEGGTVYMIIMALFVCAAVQLLLGLLSIGSLAHILRVPVYRLFPDVLVICAIGAYVVRGLQLDIQVFVGFGFLAYLLIRIGFNCGAFALGFILGPMVERSLLEAWSLASVKGFLPYIMSRPMARGMLACLLAYAVFHFCRARRKEFRPNRVRAEKRIPHLFEGLRGADFLFSLLMLLLSGGLASMLRQYPYKTALFPGIVLGSIAILMFFLLLKTIFSGKSYAGKYENPYADVQFKPLFMLGIVIGLYLACIACIGFYTSSFFAVFILSLLLKYEYFSFRLVLDSALYSILFTLLAYVIFHMLFGIVTPANIFL